MMKKLQQDTKNKTDIKPIKELARVLVKEALKNNLCEKDTLRIVQDAWDELYPGQITLKEECPEEKEFRKKASIFLEKNEESIARHVHLRDLPMSSLKGNVAVREKMETMSKEKYKSLVGNWDLLKFIYSNFNVSIETTFPLEVICAIYKAFMNFERISADDVANIAAVRLEKIYFKLRNKNRTYTRDMVNWLNSYLKSKEMTEECEEFINMYFCRNEFEKFCCRLVFEVENLK